MKDELNFIPINLSRNKANSGKKANNGEKNFMSKTKVASIAILILIALFCIDECWYTVEQGERGIVLRFGRVIDVADPGLHLKLPFMDSVQYMSIRTRKIEQKLNIYSKDIQAAQIDISTNFYLAEDSVADIYSQFGTDFARRILIPQLLSKPKDIFGKYNAVDIVQNREKLTTEILTELTRQFENTGINIESIQLENIDFSDEYERSVEERMKAEVEVQKVKQNLEREKLNADMVRTKAKGEADAQIAAATAEAEAIKLISQAEANAIRIKAEALKLNADYIKLIEAQQWDGKLPTTMLPSNSVPIVNPLNPIR